MIKQQKTNRSSSPVNPERVPRSVSRKAGGTRFFGVHYHHPLHPLHPPLSHMNIRSSCKDGSERKGNKATYTLTRLHLREITWEPLRQRLLAHLQNSPRGEAAKIAKLLGTSPSQIHRWTCPICEHDNEPNFSQGYALVVILTHPQITCPPVRTYTGKNHPAFTIL